MQSPGIRLSAAILSLGFAAASSAGPAAAEGGAKLGQPAEQATIPFVDHHSIRDWQADKRDGLWIQDIRRDWYYAKLMSPCIGLDWALSIGFVTGGASTQLDRFSSIVVPQEGRCSITSLTRSDAPPTSSKKEKHKVMEKPATTE
jgi:hypothetical protein